MALVDFTTFNDIRAALGVSSDELEDTTLSLDVYDFHLAAEFDDMVVSPVEHYLSIKDNDPEQMSNVEARFFRAMRLFSTYSCARQLLTSLPLFSPKEISDGKASMTRFTTDPYKETIKRVEAEYEKSTTRLAQALALFTSQNAPTQFARIMFLGVPSTTDPVTGT